MSRWTEDPPVKSPTQEIAVHFKNIDFFPFKIVTFKVPYLHNYFMTQNLDKYIPTNTATAARWQIAGSDYANAANSSEFFSEYLWSGSMKIWK